MKQDSLYYRDNRQTSVNKYEENRRKRIQKRLSQAPPHGHDKGMSRNFFSRKVSEINDSTEAHSIITGKIDTKHRVHYSNKIMKKIFAKQILNKEHVLKLQADNESVAMRLQ